MKRKNFRSKLVTIAAAALTMSLGTGLTVSADSYRVVTDPIYPWANSYVHIDEPHPEVKEPVRYYEPVVKQPAAASDSSDEAEAKAAELPVNAANFPDAVFRSYISENFDTDNSGGLSDIEISNATYINVEDMGISSLKGIEYFTNLKELLCDHNDLTQLDLSRNTALIRLYCRMNKLTRIDVRGCTALKYFYCEKNNLTQLDVSSCTALEMLFCYDNKLTQLDVRNCAALKSLYCEDNNLTKLDVSNCAALAELWCFNNNLTQLDVSNCKALTQLYCRVNNLTKLDVSNCTALEYLSCGDNNLTQFDVSNCAALDELWCYNNNLTQLDMSNCTALTYLDCGGNSLTQLDVSKCTALTSLNCGNNSITQLDVSKCTALSGLNCLGNKITQLDVSNCTALNRLHCAYNYIQSKSSIIGLNEAQLIECNCTVQYYEGFMFKDSDYDISEINFSIPDRLKSNKTLTKENTYILFDYEPTLPSYLFDYSYTTGAPEKLLTDDGIVFIPQSPYSIGTRIKVDCISSNKNNIKIGKSNSLYAYEPGEYTILYTEEHYDNKGGSVSVSKEFVITAVDEKDHTVHEYPSSYESYMVNGNAYHVKLCFCGEWSEEEPHSYEVKAVPYLDGTNIYYNQCTVCGDYYAIGAESSKTLTDEATGIEVTDIEGNAIPDGAQLYVTDVTDTENVELKNVAEVLDISLKSNGVEIQPDNTISVTIPVPEKVNGAKAKVFRKEANGTYTDMNAVYNPQSNKLSFVTDHLSIYAVVSGSVLGDVNNDGELTPRDLTILGKAYMQETVTAEQIAIADMDGNDRITPKDITALGKLYMSMQK